MVCTYVVYISVYAYSTYKPTDTEYVILPLVVARDLAVVVAVDIMTTGKEVGIRNEALVIETAAGKGDVE